MVTYLVADSEALGDLTDLTIKSERQMRAWLRKCCRDWFENCAEGDNSCPYDLRGKSHVDAHLRDVMGQTVELSVWLDGDPINVERGLSPGVATGPAQRAIRRWVRLGRV